MRLIIKFKPKMNFNYFEINHYDIQGLIYSLLKLDNEFSNLHNVVGFKFFNFSNIFPISDFKQNEYKKLIISSPNPKFIFALFNQLNNMEYFRLNKFNMYIDEIKIIKPKKYNKFISSTPVVLFEDNNQNKYYSFNNNGDFNFFWNRLKDNAVKKYNAYYESNFELNHDLFESFEFKKEVAVRVTKHTKTFLIIGSLWKNLEVNLNKENSKFYKFLLDTGLGEKNSLGFGMLNDVW